MLRNTSNDTGITTDQKISLMWERFVHRTDVYARQRFITDKDRWEFRPVKYCPINCGSVPCEHAVYRELTQNDVLEHLKGTQTIGLYTTKSDQTVKWLCVDIDEMNQSLVMEIAQGVAQRFGRKHCLVEFSGGKGYHIWLFFKNPIPAAQAVALGRVLTEGKDVELYPRQDSVNGAGNLVKLPLGIQRKTDERCWFLNTSFEPYEDQWQALQSVNLIDDVGELPQPATTIKAPRGDHSMPCIYNMMDRGLHEGVRDIGLHKLASYWRAYNIPYDYALDMAHRVNQRGDQLDATTVEEKVSSAYGREYSFYPCQEKGLDEYCSSSCKFFQSKAQKRGVSVAKLKEQVGS